MIGTGTKSVLAGLLCLAWLAGAGPAGCAQTDGDRAHTVVLWTRASKAEHWRADNAHDGLARLKEEAPELAAYQVRAVNDPADVADYKKKLTMAAEAGRGPDIVLSGHEDIPVWASAGYIRPLADSPDELIGKFPALGAVHPSLWPACTWNGKVWAIPQDVEARPLYFSKVKLAELGWSAAEIEELPERIRTGAFVLDDMIATARDAVARGVVRPGHGFWHRPRIGGDFLQFYVAFGGALEQNGKLAVSRTALRDWFGFHRRVVDEGVTPATLLGTEWRIWHDTVARQEVLFWQAGSWSWVDWAENYLKGQGGGQILEATTGYALVPSGMRGTPGQTLSHPLVYMITRPEVSGQNHGEVALRLLAHMTAPDLDARHALESAHLSIMKKSSVSGSTGTGDSGEEDRLAARRRFLAGIGTMLDHNYYLPNNPYYAQYFDIVWENLVAATTARKTPEQAAADAVAELVTELGPELVVE